MNTNKILTSAQATAVADALAALNNVGGMGRFVVGSAIVEAWDRGVRVERLAEGTITVVEHYDSQAGFIEAYNAS